MKVIPEKLDIYILINTSHWKKNLLD